MRRLYRKKPDDPPMRLLLPEGVDFGADPVARILTAHQTIAVVGLSSNPKRPSHVVAEYLQQAGYRIIPVNPNERQVFGENSHASVEDVPEKIDIVDIFRKAPDVPPVVQGAIRVGAKVVWMQLGIENEAAAEQALAAGLAVVMDACMLIEHKKWARSQRA
jgi:predicted CoA-binding protein